MPLPKYSAMLVKPSSACSWLGSGVRVRVRATVRRVGARVGRVRVRARARAGVRVRVRVRARPRIRVGVGAGVRVRVRVRVLCLLELLEELVVLAGALLLLLHVLLHAPALQG